MYSETQDNSINNRSAGEYLNVYLNSESCFTYWSTAGTDCGRCMAVCPYSMGYKNSYIFRRFALYMDDLFYGRKPKSRNLPSRIAM